MRAGKLILKMFIITGFVALMIFPVLMMKEMSESEQTEYRQNNAYEFKEAAYGEGRVVTRNNIEEYVVVDGKVTSDIYEYIDISEGVNDRIKYMFTIGDEVYEEEIIATVDSIEIKSTCNGIIEDIVQGEYIKICNIDEIKLVCTADRKTADKIENKENLYLENGEKLGVNRVSNIMVNNVIEIEMSVESGNLIYGQTFTGLKLFTGTIYEDVLVVDKECVYQKYEDGPYYLRVLNESMLFEGEIQVQVGFETDEYISVVNVEEGTICDSGYKSLIQVKAGIE